MLIDLNWAKQRVEECQKSSDRDPPELAMSFPLDDVEDMLREIDKLRQLVRHAWVHDGRPNCGFAQMTSNQQAMYDEITGRQQLFNQAAR